MTARLFEALCDEDGIDAGFERALDLALPLPRATTRTPGASLPTSAGAAAGGPTPAAKPSTCDACHTGDLPPALLHPFDFEHGPEWVCLMCGLDGTVFGAGRSAAEAEERRAELHEAIGDSYDTLPPRARARIDGALDDADRFLQACRWAALPASAREGLG